MLLELIFGWQHSKRPFREIQLLMILAIVGMLIGLVWLHPLLDQMLVFESEAITDPEKFYGLHRIYLWLSTFQWVAAWIWLLLSVGGWKRRIRACATA